MAASVIRFERAAIALSSRQFSPAELAVAYGYADQSHLTREFVRFAGDTPAAYAASEGAGMTVKVAVIYCLSGPAMGDVTDPSGTGLRTDGQSAILRERCGRA